MTLEERQLLLIDLSARLPYGVKYCKDSWNYEWDQEMSVIEVLERIDKEGYINYHKVYKVDDIQPYLRPLSSMTEKEEKEFNHVFELELAALEEPTSGHTIKSTASNAFVIDFYNKHHFDYRGLIEKGLALEAPKDMYNNN